MKTRNEQYAEIVEGVVYLKRLSGKEEALNFLSHMVERFNFTDSEFQFCMDICKMEINQQGEING